MKEQSNDLETTGATGASRQSNVMTAEELSAHEREIQLGDPKATKTFDGRTIDEVRRANAERDRLSRDEMIARARAQMRRQTSSRLSQSVAVSVTETGVNVASALPASGIEEIPGVHIADDVIMEEGEQINNESGAPVGEILDVIDGVTTRGEKISEPAAPEKPGSARKE